MKSGENSEFQKWNATLERQKSALLVSGWTRSVWFVTTNHKSRSVLTSFGHRIAVISCTSFSPPIISIAVNYVWNAISKTKRTSTAQHARNQSVCRTSAKNRRNPSRSTKSAVFDERSFACSIQASWQQARNTIKIHRVAAWSASVSVCLKRYSLPVVVALYANPEYREAKDRYISENESYIRENETSQV